MCVCVCVLCECVFVCECSFTLGSLTHRCAVLLLVSTDAAMEPEASDDTTAMRRYLRAHADVIARHLLPRPTLRHLLKRGVVGVSAAQNVLALPTEAQRREAAFRVLLNLDRKQMEDLCYYLDRNNASESANLLSASLYTQRPASQYHVRVSGDDVGVTANVNNNAIDTKETRDTGSVKVGQLGAGPPPSQHRVPESAAADAPGGEKPETPDTKNAQSLGQRARKKLFGSRKEEKEKKPSGPSAMERLMPKTKERQEQNEKPEDQAREEVAEVDQAPGVWSGMQTPPQSKQQDDDSKSIQGLTLTDDFEVTSDPISPPDKGGWKDGKYVGSDYVKLHVQKFFTRKVVNMRKEGDVDVQETKTKESEVTEDRMRGKDNKEFKTRKETIEEKWEEIKTKMVKLEPKRQAEVKEFSKDTKQSTTPLHAAKSVGDIAKHEVNEPLTLMSTSLQNLPKEPVLPKDKERVPQSPERAAIVSAVLRSKSVSPRRESASSSSEGQGHSRKSLSLPRPLSSYTHRKSEYDTVSSSSTVSLRRPGSRDSEDSSSLAGISGHVTGSSTSGEGHVSASSTSSHRGSRGDAGNLKTHVEMIESSVKVFKQVPGSTRLVRLSDARTATDKPAVDSEQRNKETRTSPPYQRQSKSTSSPAKELPTIIHRDVTFKLRDQYSLGEKAKPEDVKSPDGDVSHVTSPVPEACAEEPSGDPVTASRLPVSEHVEEVTRIPPDVTLTNRMDVRWTPQDVKREPEARHDGGAVDSRYEAETRRVLAELQSKSFHQGPYGKAEVVPAFHRQHDKRSFDQSSASSRATSGTTANDEAPFHPGSDAQNLTNQEQAELAQPITRTKQWPMGSATVDIPGLYQTRTRDLPPQHLDWSSEPQRPPPGPENLKKYKSEKNLPERSSASPPAPMHWSTVSLPDVKQIDHVTPPPESSLNRWKETNLDTSSDTGSEKDLRRDKSRRYRRYVETDPALPSSSYPIDSEDPRYFVQSVLNQGRQTFSQELNPAAGWTETDLDPPGTVYYTVGVNSASKNESGGWWADSDPDLHDLPTLERSRAASFPDEPSMGKSWRSFDQPHVNGRHNGHGLNIRDFEQDDFQPEVTDPFRRDRNVVYENLEPHVRYPEEREPFLDVSQELYPKGDALDHRRHRDGSHGLRGWSYQDPRDSEYPRDPEPRIPLQRFVSGDPGAGRHGGNRDNRASSTSGLQNGHHYPENRAENGQTRDSFHPTPDSPGLRADDRHLRNGPHETGPDGRYGPGPASPDMRHEPRFQQYPHHVGVPEYWERIPIEGQYSPGLPRNGPRDQGPQQADDIPDWGPRPEPGPRARVPSQDNSDLGFHELSFNSLPLSEPLQNVPRYGSPPSAAPASGQIGHAPPLDPKPNIEDLRFQQLEVHRTTAPDSARRSRKSKDAAVTPQQRRPTPQGDVSIYENLRPIDTYWPSERMDRARKGQARSADGIDLCGLALGHEVPLGADAPEADPPKEQKKRKSGSSFKKKERAMSYRFQPPGGEGHVDQNRKSDASRDSSSGRSSKRKDRHKHRPKSAVETSQHHTSMTLDNLTFDEPFRSADRHHKDRSMSYRYRPQSPLDMPQRPLEPPHTQPLPSTDTGHSSKRKKERSMSYRYRPHSEHTDSKPRRDTIEGYLDQINRNLPGPEPGDPWGSRPHPQDTVPPGRDWSQGPEPRKSSSKRHSQGTYWPQVPQDAYFHDFAPEIPRDPTANRPKRHSHGSSLYRSPSVPREHFIGESVNLRVRDDRPTAGYENWGKASQERLDTGSSYSLPRSLRFDDVSRYGDQTEQFRADTPSRRDTDLNAYFLSQV